MRLDARWSKQMSAQELRRYDHENQPMPGAGWLIGLTDDGYTLETDTHQPADITRVEASLVRLQFVDPRSGQWLEHDDPAIFAYIAVLPE